MCVWERESVLLSVSVWVTHTHTHTHTHSGHLASGSPGSPCACRFRRWRTRSVGWCGCNGPPRVWGRCWGWESLSLDSRWISTETSRNTHGYMSDSWSSVSDGCVCVSPDLWSHSSASPSCESHYWAEPYTSSPNHSWNTHTHTHTHENITHTLMRTSHTHTHENITHILYTHKHTHTRAHTHSLNHQSTHTL